jgi:1,4-alpha-glucan branching enzyme
MKKETPAHAPPPVAGTIAENENWIAGRSEQGELKMSPSSLAGKKRVTFKIETDPGSEVYICGSFNDWNPKKNKLRLKDGVYSTSILLPKGKYEYKFVIDGTWCVDPECTEWVQNSMGSLNSVVSVS